MTIVYWGLGFLPAYTTLAAVAEDFIFENFTPSSSLLGHRKIDEFAAWAEDLTEVGLFSLVITRMLLLLIIG